MKKTNLRRFAQHFHKLLVSCGFSYSVFINHRIYLLQYRLSVIGNSYLVEIVGSQIAKICML